MPCPSPHSTTLTRGDHGCVNSPLATNATTRRIARIAQTSYAPDGAPPVQLPRRPCIPSSPRIVDVWRDGDAMPPPSGATASVTSTHAPEHRWASNPPPRAPPPPNATRHLRNRRRRSAPRRTAAHRGAPRSRRDPHGVTAPSVASRSRHHPRALSAASWDGADAAPPGPNGLNCPNCPNCLLAPMASSGGKDLRTCRCARPHTAGAQARAPKARLTFGARFCRPDGCHRADHGTPWC